jgi:hypothetical protein
MTREMPVVLDVLVGEGCVQSEVKVTLALLNMQIDQLLFGRKFVVARSRRRGMIGVSLLGKDVGNALIACSSLIIFCS